MQAMGGGTTYPLVVDGLGEFQQLVVVLHLGARGAPATVDSGIAAVKVRDHDTRAPPHPPAVQQRTYMLACDTTDALSLNWSTCWCWCRLLAAPAPPASL